MKRGGLHANAALLSGGVADDITITCCFLAERGE
jgi:hypothetical protein